uniref:Uncharacterized protein n=1 Tax=Arundo donax TaxID=35708 RepID=A0A0A9EZ68_ARUDO
MHMSSSVSAALAHVCTLSTWNFASLPPPASFFCSSSPRRAMASTDCRSIPTASPSMRTQSRAASAATGARWPAAAITFIAAVALRAPPSVTVSAAHAMRAGLEPTSAAYGASVASHRDGYSVPAHHELTKPASVEGAGRAVTAPHQHKATATRTSNETLRAAMACEHTQEWRST